MTEGELLEIVRREETGRDRAMTTSGLIAYLHDRLTHVDRQVTALQATNTDYVNANRALALRVLVLENALGPMAHPCPTCAAKIGEACLGAHLGAHRRA